MIGEEGEVLMGGMWPSQRKAWDCSSFITAFVGGYGIGKSSTLSKRCIASAIFNAPNPVMVVSPSYRMASRTIVLAIRGLLDGRRIRYRYNKQDSEFLIYYGGKECRLWIGSGEHPEALKGPNLASAYLDEVFLMDKEVFDQLIARVRAPTARLREIWLAGTPENLNWGYDVCAGHLKKNYDITVFNVGTAENKALPADFVKTLYNAYDERTRQAYIEGKFVNLTTGAIYHSFEKDKHVKSMPDPGGDLYVGNDFNVDPMCGIVFWVRDGHMHVMDEIELKGESDTVEFVHEAWRVSGKRVTRFYPDPSGIQRRTSATGGVTDIALIQLEGQYLRGKPFEIRARNRTPPRRDRYNAVNEMFRNGHLTIDPKCETLIKCLTLSTYEGFAKHDGLDHMPDGLGYPVECEFSLQAKVTQGRRWYGK